MKTPSQLKAQSITDLVASLLIPVHNKSLLVPNIVIAEVVALQMISPLPEAPSWALGSILWRGEQVPVMSFEIANSEIHGRDSEQAPSRCSMRPAVSRALNILLFWCRAFRA